MTALPHDSAGAIPSGTVTFVFTDIEGSTKRWDRDHAAMEAAVRRHDVLMREAIEAHDGHVFKTIGDAFCAAFSRPDDAVAAIFDAQRALGAEDFSAVDGLRVRAAIHTGTADERDRDYFGPSVNRVARLLGIGHGGQVLLSGVTSDLVRGSLPSQTSLRDLGEHRLKDLARPENVYQLLGPELIDEFPPLRSLNAMPNNLPSVATSLIGREREVAEITALLSTHRVVTLVGSGGVGKTRTSLQVAANLLDGSGDGVWFIELAPLSRGDLIPSTVANAMRLTLPAEGDQVEHLIRALQEQRALLIFDNCEHLVEASAELVSAIVRRCARVAVLVSSRQGLGIAGEATYRIPPLTTPRDTGAMLSAAEALRYAAIELFVERARASDHRFMLTDENASTVADVCRRLDGIALAIELAAARVKILSPRQLHDKLDERFRVLTGGSRDHVPRQQTLRALIDWSYDLLDDRERILFRRLGIFVDGFTLEGASAVASGEHLEEMDVFDLLASLIDKSLVLTEPAGDTVRYRLLESTHAYALERLREAGERDLLAVRHLRYVRDRFTDIYERQEETGRNAEINDAFAMELEGVRFALDEAFARSDLVPAGAELLAAIERAWIPLGLIREGVARNEAFIAALPAGEVLLLAKLSATLGSLLLDQGRLSRSLEEATKARAYAQMSGDAATRGFALAWHARANADLGNFTDAENALIEADALPSLSARRRSNLIDSRVRLSLGSGDLDAAARAYEQRIAESRALGNDRDVHVNVANLAIVEQRRGNGARAIALVREVLPAVRRGDDRRLCAIILATLSGHLLGSNDLSGASASAHEALVLLAREPGQTLVACLLEDLALIDALEGRFARAARLAAFADAAFTKVGYRRADGDQTNRDTLMRLFEVNLDPEDGARLAGEGAALTPEAAIALARESPPVP